MKIEPTSNFSSKYYFNLTNGYDVIIDYDGVELTSIDAALRYIFEAIEELREEDFSCSNEWFGWRLEILDHSGQMLHCIPLDVPSDRLCPASAPIRQIR